MIKTISIDPSIVKTGWCVFDKNWKPIEWGMIRTKKKKELTSDQSVYCRMKQLSKAVDEIYARHPEIDNVIIEDQFLLKNVKTLKTMVLAKGGLLLPFSGKPEIIMTIEPKKWQSAILGEYDCDVKVISVESAKGYLDEFDIPIAGIILPEDAADAINIGRYWKTITTTTNR